MDIKHLSFKEMQSLVDLIFKEYYKARFVVEGFDIRNLYPVFNQLVVHESSVNYDHTEKHLLDQIEKRQNSKKIIELVDCVMGRLEEREREIIQKEFIEKESKGWWIIYYSKSTYYRLKKKAMEEFLFYLLE